MAHKKSKAQLKNNLLEIIDDFVLAVERANAAIRKLEPEKAPVEYTFDNFMKWLMHERHKKMEEEMKSNLPQPSPEGPRPGPKGKGKRVRP